MPIRNACSYLASPMPMEDAITWRWSEVRMEASIKKCKVFGDTAGSGTACIAETRGRTLGFGCGQYRRSGIIR